MLAIAFCPAPGQAAEKPAAVTSPETPREIGGGEGWTAYMFAERGGKVCYLVGKPTKIEPAHLHRAHVQAMITHRPSEHATNVVSFEAGHPFKEGTEVELEVGGQKFSLFSSKDTAWAPDAATDKAVTEALAKAKQAVVRGTSSQGTAMVDVYSLKGLPQALAAIDETCNVKR